MRGDASFVHGLERGSANPQPKSIPFHLALDWERHSSFQLLRALEPEDRYEVGARVRTPDGHGTVAACVAIQNTHPDSRDGRFWDEPTYVVVLDAPRVADRSQSIAVIVGAQALRPLEDGLVGGRDWL